MKKNTSPVLPNSNPKVVLSNGSLLSWMFYQWSHLSFIKVSFVETGSTHFYVIFCFWTGNQSPRFWGRSGWANMDWQVARENSLSLCARYCSLSQAIRDEPWWQHKDQRAWRGLKTGVGALMALRTALYQQTHITGKEQPRPMHDWLLTFSKSKGRLCDSVAFKVQKFQHLTQRVISLFTSSSQ